MAKRKLAFKKLLNFFAWLTGVLVSLTVGFAMIDKVLTVGWMPLIVTQVAGWIIVISTLLGVLMAIFNK